jgi:hypothetical protein
LPVAGEPCLLRRRIGIALFKPHFHLGNVDDYRRSLMLLYGADTVRQAEALLDRSKRFFGLDTLGPDMQGSAILDAVGSIRQAVCPGFCS